MKTLSTYFFTFLGFFLLGLQAQLFAQQADTTRQNREINPKPESFTERAHSERQMGEFMLPESGVFSYPDRIEPYQEPFMGQHYLDLAFEALREEQKNRLGKTWMKILRTIAPFVNMQFQFGVYEIEDLPIVDRDNPSFQSYKNPEKRN